MLGLFKKNKESVVSKQRREFGEFANLPNPHKEPDRNRPGVDHYISKLEEQRRFPVRLLQEAFQILSTHNRMILKPEVRAELADKVIGMVFPVLATFYKQNIRQSSLPESKERATQIISCVDVVDQLGVTFKHLFKHYYSMKNSAYQKHRSHLQLYGLRILEMIRLSQRFRALRYQKITDNDWQDCNQIFFSLILHNDVDEKNKLLGTIGTYARSNVAAESSVRKLYLSIQLIGVVDITTWPMRLFTVPDAFLEYYTDDLKIVADNGHPLPPGFLLVYLGLHGPALFERHENMPGPAVRIDYSSFFNRLVKDHENIGKQKFIGKEDVTKLSKPLAELDAADRMPLLELILLALQSRKRKQRRHAVFEQEKLRVYFGLKDVIKLMMDLYAPDLRRAMSHRSFTDHLAQSSALLSEDDRTHMSMRWKTENFSAGGMLLSTESTSFTHPIQIGQAIAVVKVEEPKENEINPNVVAQEKLSRPIIGFVCRLNRPHDRLVEVGMVRIANYAEAAILEADKAAKTDATQVILFQDTENKWKIMLPQSLNLVSGSPCYLIRTKGERILGRIGEIWANKSEFTIAEFRSPNLEKH